ncbi:MAG TPA: lytic transglycosylase domain-containing protein [Pseudolabrys sp.]
MTMSSGTGSDAAPDQLPGIKAVEERIRASVAESPAMTLDIRNEDLTAIVAAASAETTSLHVSKKELPPDVPLPPVKHRIVSRSRYEICSTLADAAHSNDLPLPFFIHLLFQESGFRPDVVSHAGAQGIAQFMPETAATVGLHNPFDPVQAIAASARLLGDLVRQFGNFGLAAAAYNAGPRRIQEWLSRKGKLPDETRHYVKTITGRPAETWRGRETGKPATALPREAPCQEMVTAAVIQPSGDPPRAIRQGALPVRIATSRRSGRDQARAVATAERRSGKRDGGRGKGAVQLAASSKKKARQQRLSQR